MGIHMHARVHCVLCMHICLNVQLIEMEESCNCARNAQAHTQCGRADKWARAHTSCMPSSVGVQNIRAVPSLCATCGFTIKWMTIIVCCTCFFYHTLPFCRIFFTRWQLNNIKNRFVQVKCFCFIWFAFFLLLLLCSFCLFFIVLLRLLLALLLFLHAINSWK